MLIQCCFIQIILVGITVCRVILPTRPFQQFEKPLEITPRQLESTSTIGPDHGRTSIIAMYPSGGGSYGFNDGNRQEWQIQENSETTFIIFGDNLNGSNLSFTSHPEWCLFERKDHEFTLIVTEPTIHTNVHIKEQARVTIKLPYYGGTLFMCLQSPNESIPLHQGNQPGLKLRISRRTIPIWATVICLIVLLTFSGLFSGLNLGLMSLTPEDLVVIQEAGTPNDRKYAKRIYPVRKRGNFLLCTILLGNVLVNSTTTILLDTLIHGVLAVVGATFAIVIFGEIIPQAICSRHGLQIGSKTIILTRIFMILTFPIAFPLSKLLDCTLGKEVGASYTRDQMNALLRHTRTTDIEESEKTIMTGVLSLKTKKIRNIMTNLIDVFMLEADEVVDDELVLTVHSYGYSRIPVYEKQRNNIIGLINIRDFALLDTKSEKFTVRSLMSFYKHRYGNTVMADDSCYDVFNKLKKEQYHLGVVMEYSNTGETDPKSRAIGIVTFEDIIEEMIQEEIIDETDVFTDNRGKIRNMLSHAPDFSAFLHQSETNYETARISAQMKFAIVQYLSTSVETFTSRFISPHILNRLLNSQFYQDFEYDEEQTKSGKPTFIYEYGKQADYFVLVLDGQAELITGKEKIVSEVGPFSYFGVSALCNSNDTTIEDIVRLNYVKFRPFIPDFSLKVSENIKILCIRRIHWLAAVRATYFENQQKTSGISSVSDSNNQQTDLLTQELQKADRADRFETSMESSSLRCRKARDRAMSMITPMDCDLIKLEYEQVHPRFRSRSISNSTCTTLPETPLTPIQNPFVSLIKNTENS